MKLAIDAKWYFDGPPSGKNVVKNLVDGIIKENYFSITLFLIVKDNPLKNNEIKDLLEFKNVKLIIVKSKINSIFNLFFLNYYLKIHKIDIVLTQNFIPFIKSKNITYINFIHDFLFLDYPNFFTIVERLNYYFIKLSAIKSDLIITISESEKNRILKHTDIENDKIYVVNNGIDNSFKVIKKSEKSKTINKYKINNQFILYVGRLNIRKNINVLIQSLNFLEKPIQLLIIGKKDYIKGVNKIIRENSNIVHFDYLNQEELSKIMGSATIFIFPSLAEGFGLPPLEAMKSGVPVIASNIEIHREIYKEGVLYFDPLSPKDLGKKIDELLKNKNLRNNLIKKGLEISQKYRWELSVRKIINIIGKINDSKKTH